MGIVSNNNTTNTNTINNSQPRKQFRQTGAGKTAIGATSGAVIGGIIMAPIFPIGVAIGGAVGGMATNKVHSAGKKRQNRKQLETFQQQHNTGNTNTTTTAAAVTNTNPGTNNDNQWQQQQYPQQQMLTRATTHMVAHVDPQLITNTATLCGLEYRPTPDSECDVAGPSDYY